MKPDLVKSILLSEIKNVASDPKIYSINPQSYFTRRRKLPLETLLKTIIGFENKSLRNELLDIFECSSDSASASAFIQQRSKVKAKIFEDLFLSFTNSISCNLDKELRFLAVDGSSIQIPTDPNDSKTFFPSKNGTKPFNLLHLNALYDINNKIYVSANVQNGREVNESKALVDMVDCSTIPKALIIADRGYEGYNNLAHITEKGWYFLIRIKDGNSGIKAGLVLPDKDTFDVKINLKLTRRQTVETKNLLADKNHYRFIPASTTFDYLKTKSRKHDPVEFYDLNFRIARFPIAEGKYETVITNLDESDYTIDDLKKLYAARWGIETSFRDLKYTIGLLNFHSKKVMCIQQEIFARLIMYNFTGIITSHVIINTKAKKYTYKANFSVAIHACKAFYFGKTTSPNLEAVIERNTIAIRPDRHNFRRLARKDYHNFLYRVA